MPKFIDLTGKRFGRIVVVKRIRKENSKKTFFKCLCDCGKEKIFQSSDLISGKIKSCGCWKSEHMKKLGKEQTKHGMTDSRLYHIWRGLRTRCNFDKSKDYNNYGGRGIKVCEEWKNSFQNFYDWAIKNGYQEHLTIDRKDVNGNYCPENCRWADMYTQTRNKRNTVNITINGETKCSTDWSRILGISRHTVKKRYLKGVINV